MRFADPSRANAIVRRRSEGATLRQVGDEFGITGKRVSQIIWKHECIEKHRLMQIDSIMTLTKDQRTGRKPIDARGADGAWHEWTPEMQAHEFGLI